MSTLSPIQEFYKDSNVFITGATGFVGKTIMDKLLRNCQDMKQIYILVRPKKGLNSQERLQNMLDNAFFERAKKENPKVKEYISIIDGDLNEDNLGLSDENCKFIKNEINIILHCAATVRFDENFKIATRLNIIATKQLLEISKQCKKLKSIVHVSTAYSHSYKPELKEQFYAPLRDPNDFIEFVNNATAEQLDKLTPNILENYPNTYTYTKGLAEDIVKKECANLPISIVRPSIIMGAFEDPFPGWIDNLYGPVGLMIGIGVGLIHTMLILPKKFVDIIPVDMTASTIIAASWANGNKNGEISQIYNIVNSQQNPLTWGKFFKLNDINYPNYIPLKTFCFAYNFRTQYTFLFNIYKFLFHTVPSHIFDFILKIMGKEPMFCKIYDKIHKAFEILKFFKTNEWNFHDDNCRKLYSALDKRDKKMFNFDVSAIEWDLYCIHNIRKMRTVVLKDPLDTIPTAVKRQTMQKISTFAVLVLLILIFYILFFVNFL